MHEFITGFFERKKGLQVTSSSINDKEKTLIKLMAQVLPQGKSPQRSTRFLTQNDQFVLSVFSMEAPTKAYVTVIFFPFRDSTQAFTHAIFLDYQQEKLVEFSRKQHQNMQEHGSYEKWRKHNARGMVMKGKEHLAKSIVPYIPQNEPGAYLPREMWEHVLYSLLTQDHIIVYSKNESKRNQFFEKISHIIPERYLRYNTFTSSCRELKGNGNILGVHEVPDVKALKQAFKEDWILVNLDTREVIGEALKKDKFIERLAWLLVDSEDAFITFLQTKTREWEAKNFQWEKGEEAETYLLETIKNIIEGKGKRSSSLFFDF